jgi:glycosyltransferase involved in cell wall biosynthesis
MSDKISVIMASHLKEYPHCAEDRVVKFHRAINSFLNQSYYNKELIVVSDGCEVTASEIRHYDNNPLIKFTMIEKQPIFSGNVRNVGCILATGNIICYLDTDDMMGINHLGSIINGFNHYNDVDWVYFNDYVIYRFNPVTKDILAKGERDVQLDYGTIGTSSIAHKNNTEINWVDCNGYGHDWTFIKTKLIDTGKKHQKINGTEYLVCHIPNSVDC